MAEMKHDVRIALVTDGPVPYGHETWADAIEAILLNELNGVVRIDKIEDFV